MTPPSPLQLAIRDCDVEEVKKLLHRYQQSDHAATEQQQQDGDFLDRLMEPESGNTDAGPPPAWLQVRDDDGRTILHEAAAQGHLELLRRLLDELESMGFLGHLINEFDPHGQPPLVEVINCDSMERHTQIKLAKLLLQNGATLETRPYRSPMHAACSKGNMEMVILFVDFAMTEEEDSPITLARLLNYQDNGGYRPLHSAAMHGYLNVVTILVQHGAEVTSMERSGGTPIEKALVNRHMDVATYLLNHLMQESAKKQTELAELEPLFVRLLRVVSLKGYEEEINLVLKSGGMIGLTKQDDRGRIALHWACQGGHKNAVKLLVETNAMGPEHLSLLDSDGFTPIRCAQIHPAIVDYLLEQGAQDLFGQLVAAVHEGTCEKLQSVLTNNDIDVNYANEEGETALWYAAGLDNIDVVKLLLDMGACINGNCVDQEDSKDDDGSNYDEKHRTPLDRAIEKKRFSIVQFLIENGADVNIRGPAAPLFYATSLYCDGGPNLSRKESYTKVIRLFLKHGADLDALDNYTHESALTMASSRGEIELVRLFVEEGADLNQSPRRHAQTPLIYASRELDFSLVKYLLDHGADPNLANVDGFVPLHYACNLGYRDEYALAHLLLARGANVFAKNKRGHSCVDSARYGPASDGESMQPVVDLVLACREDNLERVEELVQDCRVPGQVKLFTQVTRPSLIWSDFINGTVGAVQACIDGDVTILKMYQKINLMGLLQEQPCSEEYTLHFVSRHGLLSATYALIEKEADVNLQQHHGRTPISLASEAGHADVVNCLLEHGANANITDKLLNTPLHFASREGHVEVVEALIKVEGCNIHALNWVGESPITIAMNRKHKGVQSLLNGNK